MMKATDIVRRLDDLGRVVIPKEIRNTMRIKEGDSLKIFIEKNTICLEKYCQSEEEKNEKIRKYVAENRFRILSVFFDGDVTTVIFGTGKKVSVKRCSTDEFDLTMAIYYAMLKAGYRGVV